MNGFLGWLKRHFIVAIVTVIALVMIYIVYSAVGFGWWGRFYILAAVAVILVALAFADVLGKALVYGGLIVIVALVTLSSGYSFLDVPGVRSTPPSQVAAKPPAGSTTVAPSELAAMRQEFSKKFVTKEELNELNQTVSEHGNEIGRLSGQVSAIDTTMKDVSGKLDKLIEKSEPKVASISQTPKAKPAPAEKPTHVTTSARQTPPQGKVAQTRPGHQTVTPRQSKVATGYPERITPTSPGTQKTVDSSAPMSVTPMARPLQPLSPQEIARMRGIGQRMVGGTI